MKTYLVTGGAGFIGNSFVREGVAQGNTIVNLDKLTYAGNLDSLKEVSENPLHRFVHGDIGDRKVVGGFEYSYSPTGKVVGRVGTGLSDDLRSDMAANPERYLGRVAMVAGTKYRSGVGRTLSFKGWHPEKGGIGGYTHKELKPAVSK